MSLYSLNVISHHPEFKNKTLKKYHVDQIDTVGVWGNEEFEVQFRNHSGAKVQVKLSLDGIDILTGKTADTELGEMWLVQPYDTLSVKAWQETEHGGARFVFADTSHSVALHTSGDVSHRGIIAAAVFVETAKPTYISNSYKLSYDPFGTYPRSYRLPLGGVLRSSTSSDNFNPISENSTRRGAVLDSMELSGTFDVQEASVECNTGKSLESNVAKSVASVGAGAHLEQKINHVTGLVKPMYSQSLRIRYLWWDDLLAKLHNPQQGQLHPSGFPGDVNKVLCDLSGVPRVDTSVLNAIDPNVTFTRV